MPHALESAASGVARNDLGHFRHDKALARVIAPGLELNICLWTRNCTV
jgi:hypothetical protein